MSVGAVTDRRRSTSDADTRRLGHELAAELVAGDCVALRGDLGAGKTCLIQGIADGLGVRDVVNSPTFVLLNVYEGTALRVYHFDLYRLTTRDELEEIGAAEFFTAPDAVSLVEWADRVPEALPRRRWEIDIEHGAEPEARHIRWSRPDGAAGEGDRE